MSTPYYAPSEHSQSSIEQIRALNDAFRTQPFIGAALASDELVITRGVADHGNGEHDFGSFVLDAVKLFWKIDYYDRKLEYGSPDPADPAVTRRVLTILLAEEY